MTASKLDQATTIDVNPAACWQETLRRAITSPEELFERLKLPAKLLAGAKAAAELFPLRVPLPYLERIEAGNPSDPLLRQVLPLGLEQHTSMGYSDDPLGEKEANPVAGLIHKYHGRVLLIGSPQCAVNCRYCFRRAFDYRSNTPSRSEWQTAINYIECDNSIEEVIFSGGDPLSLSDRQLQWLIERVSGIKHVTRIRFHSRLPIMVPSRVSDELLAILSSIPIPCTVVLHCNHAQEIDEHVQYALKQLRQAGLTLLNQAVLLKSVNDSANSLIALNKQLFRSGVLPYYLHLMDKVTGSAHFEVPEAIGRQIHKDLQAALPGYLVPKLVREERGAICKTLVQ